LQDNQQGTPLHYIDGLAKNQVTEMEIERHAHDLFADTPIPFRPRKGHDLDEKIALAIHNKYITLPVMHIRDNLYLVGPNRYNCELKAGNPMIKAGGGY